MRDRTFVRCIRSSTCPLKGDDMDRREQLSYFKERPSLPPHLMGDKEYDLPSQDDDPLIDLREYWRTIRRRLWLAIALPLVFVAFTAIHDLMTPRLYTAQTTILIKSTAPSFYSPAEAPGGWAETDLPWLDAQTDYRLLAARSLAANVILVEGLRANPAFVGARGDVAVAQMIDRRNDETAATANAQVTSQLIDRYLGALKVTPIDNTELVAISFTTSNAELSAQLANAHVREFIKQRIELNSQASIEAATFLKKKLAQLKQQVEDSEMALNSYRRDNGIIPGLISANGQDVLLGRLDKLSEQAQQAHLANLTFETQVALISQGHADALPAIIDSKIVQGLKESLDALQTQYLSMSSQFKPDYPAMLALSAKIKGTRDALAREVGNVVASVKTQYGASIKDEEALDAELKREKDFAFGLNDAAVKYAILKREVDTNNQLYNAVLKRMKDIDLAGDVHGSNISIVDMASAPSAPSSPKERRDLLEATLLGLMVGVGLAFLLEWQDHTFRDPNDAESYLRVPVLGTVPDMQRVRGTTYGGRALRGSAMTPPLAVANRSALAYGGHSLIGETYRKLRTALLLSRAGSPPKTVLLASVIPAEGKTTTAANLAVVLAGTGRRVLLIDADLRRPTCHELFGQDNHLGLTESLTGMSEVKELVCPTGFENLDLLSSGERPPNPSELLGSGKMQEILNQLSEHYECIIIDSAPITPVTDAVVLSSIVDGVILVVDRQTPRQRVRAALSQLQYVYAKVFGVILNRFEPDEFKYRAERGYHSGYYVYEQSSANVSATDKQADDSASL